MGRRKLPLCIPVSQGPRHLCCQPPPLSHSGDSEVAGEGGHGHGWAQRRGAALEGFGVLRGSSEAARPRPRPAKCGCRGVPPGCLPVPAPPGTPLGWRCLPGALRPPRTLPAVCFQFLLASAPPRFLPIKKKIPGIFSACGSQRLERCCALLWQAGAVRGGDGGCPRCPASPFTWGVGSGTVLQDPRAQVFLLRPFCSSALWTRVWDLLVQGVWGAWGCRGPVTHGAMPRAEPVPGGAERLAGTGSRFAAWRGEGWCRQSRARPCPRSLTVSLSPVP